MAKPLIELPYHNGAGIPLREPVTIYLGWCDCGCRERLEAGYERVEWNDMVFSSRECVFAWMKKNDGLREVS